MPRGGTIMARFGRLSPSSAIPAFLVAFGLLAGASRGVAGNDERNYGDAVVAEIVSVYDGDTFKANLKGYPPIIGDTISIRIAGVDTPELRGTKGYTQQQARKARMYAENRLRSAKVVTLKNMRRDKYFRILADVYVDRWSLAKELIRVGLGKPYDGGTRPTW